MSAIALTLGSPRPRRVRGDDSWLGWCLPARPDIEHVAILRAKFVDPALALIGAGAAALTIDRDQGRLDVGLHLAAVAADVNYRATFDQAPDAVPLRRDQVLHIGFWALAARERG